MMGPLEELLLEASHLESDLKTRHYQYQQKEDDNDPDLQVASRQQEDEESALLQQSEEMAEDHKILAELEKKQIEIDELQLQLDQKSKKMAEQMVDFEKQTEDLKREFNLRHSALLAEKQKEIEAIKSELQIHLDSSSNSSQGGFTNEKHMHKNSNVDPQQSATDQGSTQTSISLSFAGQPSQVLTCAAPDPCDQSTLIEVKSRLSKAQGHYFITNHSIFYIMITILLQIIQCFGIDDLPALCIRGQQQLVYRCSLLHKQCCWIEG